VDKISNNCALMGILTACTDVQIPNFDEFFYTFKITSHKFSFYRSYS